MKRCAYPGCGGSLVTEPNELTLTDRRPLVTRCLSCVREPEPLQFPDPECQSPGCQRQDLRDGLCPIHWRRKVVAG